MIVDILKSNRPRLSESTLRTYTSILNSLFRKMNQQKEVTADNVFKFFQNHSSTVMDYLKDMPANKRKTILASLVTLCVGHDCVEVYRNQMLKDARLYNTEQRDQLKTDTQKKSWISQAEVMKIYRSLERKAQPLFKKVQLSNEEFETLQNYIILSLYVLIPPRRLLDYIYFKIRNVNKDKDNYMEGRKFFFNRYKTDYKYKKQEVAIPLKLKQLIDKWMTKTDGDFLLEERNRAFTPSQLTLRLNKIFGGRKISVNQLRHTFITDEVLKDAPRLKKLEEIAEDMGHSTDQQQLYRKV